MVALYATILAENGNLAKTGKIDKKSQASANHITDFEPPIFRGQEQEDIRLVDAVLYAGGDC